MDYTKIMRQLWQDACQDKSNRPSVKVADGQFVLTITGNRDNWLSMCQAAGVPTDAQQVVDGDTLTVRWTSHADAIFGDGGMLAQRFGPGYEVRTAQLHMARLCQRSIEMNAPATIEAGTGVGKSFAYAAICMAMGKKVVISTSNKNLQMQLYRKDLPFLQSLFPGKKVALSVGKSNYACRVRCDSDMQAGEKIGNAQLAEWYLRTATGNVEEIDFAVDWKEQSAITVDDSCTGKHCPLYYNCFYYVARDTARQADVIVTNHALLVLDAMYSNNILPPADVIVVDEAHKLPDYVRNALGVELTAPQIDKAINLAMGFADDAAIDDAQTQAMHFGRELDEYLHGKDDAQVSVHRDNVFEFGVNLSDALDALADEVWSPDELPTGAEETALSKRSQRIRNRAVEVRMFSDMTQVGYVRWIDQQRGDNPRKACAQPFDVSAFIARMAGVTEVTAGETPDYTHCTRCHRTLTAAHVALLDGKPYGPECIKHVDPLGDANVVSLTEWLASEHEPQTEDEPRRGTKAVIFTSATLAAPDMAHFWRTCGLPDAMWMQAQSPFDYANNALLYLPGGSNPAPSDPAWMHWAIDEMRSLVLAASGGAFLLFTSYKAMGQAVNELRYTFVARGLNVFVQGELPKLEIARRFKEDGNAVLFATKSFFEGVSIDGNALRLVIIDKLPFEAPSPLTQAMEADMLEHARAMGVNGRALEMYPFDNLRVPRMIIDLKQGAGRLIRTQSDRGVIAILDSRVRASQYGRNKVLPALLPAALTSTSAAVSIFFGAVQPHAPATRRRGLEPVLAI